MQEPIPTSLLKLPTDHQARAVKMFQGILRYCGDTGEAPSLSQSIEIAQKLLHQVWLLGSVLSAASEHLVSMPAAANTICIHGSLCLRCEFAQLVCTCH